MLTRKETHTTPIGIQQTGIINHLPATMPPTQTPAPTSTPTPTPTPTPTQVNAELQPTVPLLTNTNQSVIGAVASFILVGEQTGDFSLISEEKEKNNLTNHIHALFRLNFFNYKCRQIAMEWTSGKILLQKIGIEERLQENWWRGA